MFDCCRILPVSMEGLLPGGKRGCCAGRGAGAAIGIVDSPGDYPWSSARHYLGQYVDPLIQQTPLSAMVNDWQTFLSGDVDAESRAAIGRAERSGRPLGDADFIAKLEGVLGRTLRRQKPGSKAGGD